MLHHRLSPCGDCQYSVASYAGSLEPEQGFPPCPQVEFMRRQRLAYEAVGGAEYEALKPELVRVQEAQGNLAFAAEIKQPASRDAFFKARTLCPKP